MKSIPQEHDGIHYRSRTEARWGEFWSLADLSFEYEPEGFDLFGDWYVPDFKVGPIYFEIKGAAPTARERMLARLLARETVSKVVIASGNPGSATMRSFSSDGSESDCYLVAEFKRGDGAWLAQSLDGGGWAIPLAKGLANCSADGSAHPMLAVAGRLQFNAPVFAERDPRMPTHIGTAVNGVISNLRKRTP